MDVRKRPVDATFERRVDAIGWGVLLAALGGVLLLPEAPEELWLVVVGGVMVVLSGVRAAIGLPVVWFTTMVGMGALVWGGAAVLGFPDEAAAFALLAVGVLIVAGEVLRGSGSALSQPAE